MRSLLFWFLLILPSSGQSIERLEDAMTGYLGATYVAGRLDAGAERVWVQRDSLDCVTFVENVLARAFARDTTEVQSYLRALRYRDDDDVRYGNRLHYFSEWMVQNTSEGYLQSTHPAAALMTDRPQHYSFMSANVEAYAPMVRDTQLVQQIKRVESRLSGSTLSFIATADVVSAQSLFQTGDVIAFVTDIEGLDVVHTALIWRPEDKKNVGFMHASPGRGVVIESSLLDYLTNRSRVIGIMIARPDLPRLGSQ